MIHIGHSGDRLRCCEQVINEKQIKPMCKIQVKKCRKKSKNKFKISKIFDNIIHDQKNMQKVEASQILK